MDQVMKKNHSHQRSPAKDIFQLSGKKLQSGNSHEVDGPDEQRRFVESQRQVTKLRAGLPPRGATAPVMKVSEENSKVH